MAGPKQGGPPKTVGRPSGTQVPACPGHPVRRAARPTPDTRHLPPPRGGLEVHSRQTRLGAAPSRPPGHLPGARGLPAGPPEPRRQTGLPPAGDGKGV